MDYGCPSFEFGVTVDFTKKNVAEMFRMHPQFFASRGIKEAEFIEIIEYKYPTATKQNRKMVLTNGFSINKQERTFVGFVFVADPTDTVKDVFEPHQTAGSTFFYGMVVKDCRNVQRSITDLCSELCKLDFWPSDDKSGQTQTTASASYCEGDRIVSLLSVSGVQYAYVLYIRTKKNSRSFEMTTPLSKVASRIDNDLDSLRHEIDKLAADFYKNINHISDEEEEDEEEDEEDEDQIDVQNMPQLIPVSAAQTEQKPCFMLLWAFNFNHIIMNQGRPQCYIECSLNSNSRYPVIMYNPLRGTVHVFSDTVPDAGKFMTPSSAIDQLPYIAEMAIMRRENTPFLHLSLPQNMKMEKTRTEDKDNVLAFRKTAFSWVYPQNWEQEYRAIGRNCETPSRKKATLIAENEALLVHETSSFIKYMNKGTDSGPEQKEITLVPVRISQVIPARQFRRMTHETFVNFHINNNLEFIVVRTSELERIVYILGRVGPERAEMMTFDTNVCNGVTYLYIKTQILIPTPK